MMALRIAAENGFEQYRQYHSLGFLFPGNVSKEEEKR